MKNDREGISAGDVSLTHGKVGVGAGEAGKNYEWAGPKHFGFINKNVCQWIHSSCDDDAQSIAQSGSQEHRKNSNNCRFRIIIMRAIWLVTLCIEKFVR